MEKQWGIPLGTINPKPGLHTIALWNAFSEAKVKAMFVLCTNPAHSLPNVNIYTEGMKRTDNFMVLSEPFIVMSFCRRLSGARREAPTDVRRGDTLF